MPGAAGVPCLGVSSNAPVAKHNQHADTNTRVAKAVSDWYVTDDLQICNPLLSFLWQKALWVKTQTHVQGLTQIFTVYSLWKNMFKGHFTYPHCGVKTEANGVCNHALYLLHQADCLHFQQVLAGITHKSFWLFLQWVEDINVTCIISGPTLCHSAWLQTILMALWAHGMYG